jgi:hypothetical protein
VSVMLSNVLVPGILSLSFCISSVVVFDFVMPSKLMNLCCYMGRACLIETLLRNTPCQT